MFQPRTRVGPAKVLIFGTLGFAIGLFLGYIFMGTTHAVRSTLPFNTSVACKRCEPGSIPDDICARNHQVIGAGPSTSSRVSIAAHAQGHSSSCFSRGDLRWVWSLCHQCISNVCPVDAVSWSWYMHASECTCHCPEAEVHVLLYRRIDW